MIKKITTTICALVVGLTFQSAFAESDENRFEVGGQVSVMRVPTRFVSPFPFTVNESRTSDFGFGGRFGYNVSSHFAAEAEVNVFPADDDVRAGRKLQGLFGVRAGKKMEKIGVFAKARPGFVRYEKGDYFQARVCPAVSPLPFGCFDPVARTSFAMDLGGVVELYPTSRTIIRFDAGDTIVRLPARLVAMPQTANGLLLALTVPQETRHQFQVSIGFGFRF